jgi:hypothetical protein
MELSQGNSLCSNPYLKQAKMSCVLFSLFSFFFYKIREQDGEHVLPGGRAGSSTMGEVLGKGDGA